MRKACQISKIPRDVICFAATIPSKPSGNVLPACVFRLLRVEFLFQSGCGLRPCSSTSKPGCRKVRVLGMNAVRRSTTTQRRDPFTLNTARSDIQKKSGNFTRPILLNQVAKKAFDDLNLKKFPTVASFCANYTPMFVEKKKAYSEYRQTKIEMRELLTAKTNVDRLLNITSRRTER